MLANNCVACHGVDGNSAGPAIPSIAGMDKGNFFDIMDSYRSEDGRYSTIMGRIAKGFNDHEIELLASYFSSKRRITPEQQIDQVLVARGAEIHEKSCEKCHADLDGGDIILNGQWQPYLLNTMHDFSELDLRDIRMKDLKKMVKKLKRLSTDERQAIASFYASRKYEEASDD
jgi:sulfide dehydrogenase cytochrome subunit